MRTETLLSYIYYKKKLFLHGSNVVQLV